MLNGKYLKVRGDIDKFKWNRYLLKPYKPGEIVKVAPIEEQVSSTGKVSNENFRRNYVTVYRKDDNGKWSIKYVNGWDLFRELGKK